MLNTAHPEEHSKQGQTDATWKKSAFLLDVGRFLHRGLRIARQPGPIGGSWRHYQRNWHDRSDWSMVLMLFNVFVLFVLAIFVYGLLNSAENHALRYVTAVRLGQISPHQGGGETASGARPRWLPALLRGDYGRQHP